MPVDDDLDEEKLWQHINEYKTGSSKIMALSLQPAGLQM